MSLFSRLWPFRKKEIEKSDRVPEISRVARSEDETFIPGTGNDPDISARGDSPEGTVVMTPGKKDGSKGHGPAAVPSPSDPVLDSSGVRIYEPGQVIGEDFEVSERLEGGMGYVYIGRHLHYHMPMAVKQSKQGGEYLRRLKIEAEAWNRLGLHPHIAYCYWVKEIDDWPFIFVEYIEGSNLRDWIYEGRCWELDTGLNMAIEICHGLKHAHDSGMLHRDVKPANILVDKAGTIKVTDFGLAGTGGLEKAGFRPEAASDATHTMPGIGTPAYMPPEQWTDAHNLGKEADIFSFGMCLWEMVCGARAYDSTVERSEPGSIDRLRPGLPERLKSLLLRLVAWEAKDRPGDFNEVIEELNGVYRELYGEDAPSYRLPELDVAADNLNNQGVSYWELGQYDKARECFKKAVEKESAHPQANFNLGNFEMLNDLLHHSATRAAVLEMLRAVLRNTQLNEDDVERRVANVKENKEFFNGIMITLREHTEPVYSNLYSTAFSPDGRYLASGSENIIRIWDVESGQEVKLLKGYFGTVSSVVFSPDGHYLASASEDTTIRIWDVESGQEVRSFEGHADGIWSVAFSPDGRYLASGSLDETVRLWLVETEEELWALKGHTSEVRSVVFSPDGHYLASASEDTTIRIWDVESGQEVRSFEGHADGVWSVAFSPDGSYLASGSEDETVRLWKVDTGENLRALKGYTWQVRYSVYSVSFSPNGRYLATAGNWDGTVNIWEISSGQEVRVLKGHTCQVRSVAFSPDGRYLASGSEDETICIWSGILKGAFSIPRNFTALKNKEDKRMKRLSELEKIAEDGAVSKAVAGALKAWHEENNAINSTFHSFLKKHWAIFPPDIDRLVVLATLRGRTHNDEYTPDPEVHTVIFSPDGRYLATAGNWDGTINIWEISSGQEVRVLKGHTYQVHSVAFSPDGHYLASGSKDYTIRFWDTETGEELRALKGHTDDVTSVAFSPDARYLASGSEDNTIRFWDTETGEELRALKGHTDDVTSVAFSPDGRYLASGSKDNTIRLWDAETGKELRALKGHTDDVTSVAFSPDGRYLASGSKDNTIRFWDTETGKELRVLKGHTMWVTSIAFSPDGRYLASGSVDNTIRFWDTETGEELKVLKGHVMWVYSVAFSPDGRYLASGSNDNTIGLYCFLPKIEKS